MNDWLLWSRFILLNGLGFAALLLLHINGVIAEIFVGDSSHISVGIFCLFIVGLILTANQIFRISRDLNFLKAGRGVKVKEFFHLVEKKNETSAREAIEIKAFAKIQWIKRIASSLVSLGLIGTVYGSVVFLLGIDLTAVGDVEQVGAVFAVVMNGMGIALYTTLVGAVLNLWLSFNYGIVEHGIAHLIANLISYDIPQSPETVQLNEAS